MTVQELIDVLDGYGGHLPVRILIETAHGVPAVDTAYGIDVGDRDVDAEATVLLAIDREDAVPAP